MKTMIGVFIAAARIGLLILLLQGLAVEAAEVKVMCAKPVEGLMKELGPRFEAATGHKLDIAYEVTTVLKRRINAGEAFDITILLPALIDELTAQGKITAGTGIGIARSPLGVGVRSGASKPDIGTVEAFQRTLRNAKSIAYSKEGQSGVHFMRVLERLGLTEELKVKLKPTPADQFAKVVPSGEAEMIVIPISAIMSPGMDLVGPVPSELQNYFVFTAGIGANVKEPEAAKALLKFLVAPENVSVLKEKGMEPAGP